MKQIRLSKGLYTLVDDDDYEWLMQWKWTASFDSHTKWYAIRREKVDGRSRKVCMHRAILERRGVNIPRGYVVDHVNNNGLDNRYLGCDGNLQLEPVSPRENMLRTKNWKRKVVTHVE